MEISMPYSAIPSPSATKMARRRGRADERHTARVGSRLSRFLTRRACRERTDHADRENKGKRSELHQHSRLSALTAGYRLNGDQNGADQKYNRQSHQ